MRKILLLSLLAISGCSSNPTKLVDQARTEALECMSKDTVSMDNGISSPGDTGKEIDFSCSNKMLDFYTQSCEAIKDKKYYSTCINTGRTLVFKNTLSVKHTDYDRMVSCILNNLTAGQKIASICSSEIDLGVKFVCSTEKDVSLCINANKKLGENTIQDIILNVNSNN